VPASEDGGRRANASPFADTGPPVIVRLPGLLWSYTGGADQVELGAPATLGDAVNALDARFPGLRFRIIDEQDAVRPHIKLFVDGALVRNLTEPLAMPRELMIVGALSGG
jgi:molybdopterin synthase sulfur carrier subunit